MTERFSGISTFRTGLYIQIGAIVLMITGGAVYLIVAMQKILGNWIYAMVLLLILLGITLIWTAYLKHLYRLEVNADGITRRHSLTKTEEFFPFDRLEQIDLENEQISNANGPLTEGFTRIILRYSDGREILLSPRIYGNFYDLSLQIVRLHNEKINEKLDKLAEQIIRQKLEEYGRKK